MERQPYDVFLESWGAEMHSLVWTAPFPEELRERALHALRSGRWRAWSYARDVLGWSNEEAVLACRFIELPSSTGCVPTAWTARCSPRASRRRRRAGARSWR